MPTAAWPASWPSTPWRPPPADSGGQRRAAAGPGRAGAWQDRRVREQHRPVRNPFTGRAESALQARLLTTLRDDGPLSRAQLADVLDVSRTTIALEVGRLGELGLALETGPGRLPWRSPLDHGRPAPGPPLRRHLDRRHRHGGRRHRRTARGAGAAHVRPSTSARAPRGCWRPRSRWRASCSPSWALERPVGAGIGVPGPVDFDRGVSVSPPIMPGWDGYPVRDVVSRALGCPALLDNDVNVLAAGEQHAGVARSSRDFLFVKIGTGIGCGIVVGGESTAGWTAAPATSATSASRTPARSARAATPAASRPSPGEPRSPATPRPPPGPAARPALAELLAEKGALTAADVGLAVTRGDAVALQLIRDSGQRVGQVLASLVSFFNPGLIVIGGGADRRRSRAAGRDPQRHLPPVAAAGHRQPADRAQRAGTGGRGRRCRRG